MNTELEKNSAPKIVEIIEENEIEAVALDIDNTLVKTADYYDHAIFELGIDIAEFSLITNSSEQIAKEFVDTVTQIFTERNFKPILIQDLCIQALGRYFKDDVDTKLIQNVQATLFNFYNESPLPYQVTKEFLQTLKVVNVKTVLHSHAQEEWTRMKADLLGSLVDSRIPFLATDMTLEKDPESWLKAVEIVETGIARSMVIGDNFFADILPAIEAGCKNLVWIDRWGKGLPKEYIVPEDINLFVVNDLSELL